MLKEIVVTLLMIGAISEFVVAKRKGWQTLIASSGAVFALIAILIWLFG